MEDLLGSFENIKSLLLKDYSAKAYELGAIYHPRNISRPEDLLKLILFYLTNGKNAGGTASKVIIKPLKWPVPILVKALAKFNPNILYPLLDYSFSLVYVLPNIYKVSLSINL